MSRDKIKQLQENLAEIRIKHGVDYVILHKYELTHVLCPKVWKREISEQAEKLGLEIDEWYFTVRN
jgi:hypothetical protein